MGEIKERKITTAQRLVTVAHKCDCCERVVVGGSLPDSWIRLGVVFSYASWEIDWDEACSPKCFIDLLDAYLLEDEGDDELSEIAEMTPEFARSLVKLVRGGKA